MGEPVWTTAEIGGAIPSNCLGALADAFNAEFYEGDPSPSDVPEMAREMAEAKTTLVLSGMCNYGNPDTLKAFLQEVGLSYAVKFEASVGSWDSGYHYWEPGMDEELACGADESGAPVMTSKEIREHLTAGTLAARLDEIEKISGAKLPPLSIGPKRTEPMDGFDLDDADEDEDEDA
jgi:hypothetical protein